MWSKNSHELLHSIAAEDGDTLLDCYARIDRCSLKFSEQVFRMGELFSDTIDDFASFRSHAQLLADDSDSLLEVINDTAHKIIVGYTEIPMALRLQELYPIIYQDDRLRTHSFAQVLGIEEPESAAGSLHDFLESYLITEDDEAMKGLGLNADDISENVYSMIIDEHLAYANADIPRFITCLVIGDSSYWSDGSE